MMEIDVSRKSGMICRNMGIPTSETEEVKYVSKSLQHEAQTTGEKRQAEGPLCSDHGKVASTGSRRDAEIKQVMPVAAAQVAHLGSVTMRH
jgi:hypothetical protein